MLIKTIFFKNNLIKQIKSKSILNTNEKFLELKKDYNIDFNNFEKIITLMRCNKAA